MTAVSPFYFKRLLARALDLMCVLLVLTVLEQLFDLSGVHWLVGFILYNWLVILFNGHTLGRFVFSLSVSTGGTGAGRMVRLMLRELLLWLLLPIILLNALNMSPLALHDRITGSRIIQDEL